MDLIGYLETLPKEAIARLYTSPWTCQAVLRGLPTLGKLYALRLVLLESTISEIILDSWPSPEGASKHRVAMERLKALLILQEGPTRGGEASWQLQTDFRKHLRSVLSGTASDGVSAGGDISDAVLAASPTRAALDSYANNQWEALLLVLVGSSTMLPKADPLLGKGWMEIDSLLVSAKLLKLGEGRDVTEDGFQFLLLDTYHQLWLLLKQYIEAAATGSGTFVLNISQSGEVAGEKLAHVVSFLLQLGCQGVGNPLPTAKFDSLELCIAADLSKLGLLLPFRAQGKIWLCPTKLCMALTGGQSAELQKEVTDGYIVVETNYRVVGYTASAIKLAILRMFVRCDVLLPNAFIGTLTRESVTEALKFGISHEQIVNYLTQHADSHVSNNTPVVPARWPLKDLLNTFKLVSELRVFYFIRAMEPYTSYCKRGQIFAAQVVSDQIRLWQAETKRVTPYKSYLYDTFETPELFHKTCQHARMLGTWLWEDTEQQRLAALADGHSQLREFIKSNK